jgi:hypothetical protein
MYLSYLYEPKYVDVQLCMFNYRSTYFGLINFIMVVLSLYMSRGYEVIIPYVS